jgi:hypothetical protein
VARPASCANPGTGSPCLTQSSDNAAFVYFTSGGLNFTGGNFHANRTAIIMTAASGQVKVTGGAPPSWTSPTEGPFAGLSLWTEGKNGPFQINGGAGITLSGAFFTPEAVMSLSGGGDFSEAQVVVARTRVLQRLHGKSLAPGGPADLSELCTTTVGNSDENGSSVC